MSFRIRVHTQSGSAYVLDRDAMTWERLNINVGHEDILGYEGVRGGRLLSPFPRPVVGEGMVLYVGGASTLDVIRTTPVVRVEDISS